MVDKSGVISTFLRGRSSYSVFYLSEISNINSPGENFIISQSLSLVQINLAALISISLEMKLHMNNCFNRDICELYGAESWRELWEAVNLIEV